MPILGSQDGYDAQSESRQSHQAPHSGELSASTGVLGKPLASDEALAGAPVSTVEVLQFCREIQAE